MKQFIIIASCSLPLLLAGCGTAPIKPYQAASSSTSERTAQASGVEVALDPFVESSRTKEYFDVDAVANGLAILHVRVVNTTSNQTYLVEKKNFQLLRNGAEDLAGDGKRTEGSNTGANVIAWGGLVVYGALTPAAMLTSMSMISRATEVQRNFTAKEMGDQTLSPGQSMEGFLYFTPVKKGEDWSRVAVVQANLMSTKDHQVIELRIPLSQ